MRRAALAGLILLVVLIALGAVARAVAPGVLRHRLIAQVHESCPACRFNIKSIDLEVLKGRAVAHEVWLVGDPADGTHFSAMAESVDVDAKLWSLVRREPWIERARIEGMDLTIADYADPPPNTEPPRYAWLAKLPAMHVERMEVRRSRFTYAVDPPGDQKIPNTDEALARKKHRAYVRFHDVDADSGPFGTRPWLSGGFLVATATARQGKSARVRVVARIGLHQNEKDDDLEVWAKNADLADLDTFLVGDDGLRISGVLRAGHSTIRIRQRKLIDRMELDYDQLHVQYLKGYKGRSGLKSAFLSTLANAMVRDDKHPGGRTGKSSAEVSVDQDRLENVFSLVVDGLRKGALKIAKSG